LATASSNATSTAAAGTRCPSRRAAAAVSASSAASTAVEVYRVDPASWYTDVPSERRSPAGSVTGCRTSSRSENAGDSARVTTASTAPPTSARGIPAVRACRSASARTWCSAQVARVAATVDSTAPVVRSTHSPVTGGDGRSGRWPSAADR